MEGGPPSSLFHEYGGCSLRKVQLLRVGTRCPDELAALVVVGYFVNHLEPYG